jgi:hypothetical protein
MALAFLAAPLAQEAVVQSHRLELSPRTFSSNFLLERFLSTESFRLRKVEDGDVTG